MSEEEKEAVEQLRSWRKYIIEHRESVNKANDIEFYLSTALNLIEKQQKKLNSLKQIEQLHQEENGKLRVELEQEKEKNRELEEKQSRLAFKTNQYMNDVLTNNIISKDKIREKIEEIEKEIEIEGLSEKDNDLIYTPYALYKYAQNNLKQLLEEV